MSDPLHRTAKSAERNLATRFASYLFALAVFAGAHLIYRTEGISFDIIAGLMASSLVYTSLKFAKRGLGSDREIIDQLIAYRKADYKLSGLYKGRSAEVCFWVVPIVFVPILLYTNDFPIELLRFGVTLIAGSIGIYLWEITRSLKFYESMDKHIEWGELEKRYSDKSGQETRERE